MPTIQPIQSKEQLLDFRFPLQGIDLTQAFSLQRMGTTPIANNVVAFEPSTGRARGGQRAGLSKYVPAQLPGGSKLVQHLGVIVSNAAACLLQGSVSQRCVTLIAVQGGNVYTVNPGNQAAGWVTPVNNTGRTPPLSASAVWIDGDSIVGKYYIVDGANYVYYDPVSQSINNWGSTAGSLPGVPGNTCRIVKNWRGRAVKSGLLSSSQDWFMSAVGDPTNNDYSPLSVSPTEAVEGDDGYFGKIGDVITSVMPISDDLLLMGGDHTLWLIAGDLLSGGQILNVSEAIGVAFGAPWCKDPYGNIYFVSNRGSVYSYQPGGQVQRISQQIEYALNQIDTGANLIRLAWNDRQQSLEMFVTSTSGAVAATHFTWEYRSNAWFNRTFANNNHNPIALCQFDGNTPQDRWVLIGSWDGYVRALDATATTDDGTAINSDVVLGLIEGTADEDTLLTDMHALMGEASGSVNWALYLGLSPELALTSTAAASGTFTPGRNFNQLVQRTGHAHWLRITANQFWCMERVWARFNLKYGKPRRRGKF